jgi:hypothetical protein
MGNGSCIDCEITIIDTKMLSFLTRESFDIYGKLDIYGTNHPKERMYDDGPLDRPAMEVGIGVN